MQQETSFYTSEMQLEVRDYVEKLEEEIAKYPSILERSPNEVREDQENGVGRYQEPSLSDVAITMEIPGYNVSVHVRAFIPRGDIDGVYLHIHGGGWVIGRAHHQDRILEAIMDECNAAVNSVDSLS